MEGLFEQQEGSESAQAGVEKTPMPQQDSGPDIMGGFSSAPSGTVNPPAQPFVPSESAKALFEDPQPASIPDALPAAQANTPASTEMGDVPMVQRQPVNSGINEALQKQIFARTANIDARTKEKETKQQEAAESYMKEENAKREVRLKETKESHLREQEVEDLKQKEYKKGAFLWGGVGMHTDLSKANRYSKDTERMRGILTRLGAPEST